MNQICDRGEDLLDLVYGEATAERRAQVESHVARCPACARELSELQAVRTRLNEWGAPSWKRPPPEKSSEWWRLTAAAVVLVALGGAFRLSGGAVRAGTGGVELSWGRLSSSEAEVRGLLAQAEERHRRDIEALRASTAVRAASPRGTSGDSSEVLRQVSRMIAASESRQSATFRASLMDMAAETERRRRIDLAKVSAGLSYLEGKNGQQAARTTELMGYLVQVADQRK